MVQNGNDSHRFNWKQNGTGCDVNPPSNSKRNVIPWICLGAIAVILLNVARSIPQISDILMGGDSDDLMRLQQVRDLLSGQSWFDTRQYRVLPPEGISMHWTRYIDAGIAAILIPASWVMSQTAAEHAAIILWPTFLAILMILVIGPANNRLLGPAAAIGALTVFLTWSKLGGEFASARIDHHNVQLLCCTAIFYLSLLPGRPRLRGALAGALTALSLAVGLEMLPFLAVVWGLMILRHAFDEPDTSAWLLGFCAGIAIGAPVLMAGQTPIRNWGVNHCDVLAPPILALGAVGIVASLVPVLAARSIRRPLTRILVAVAITGAGIWLASPLLLPCLAGPYATVAPEVRTIIETRVIEALPVGTLLASNPALPARVLLSAVLITLLALGTAWHLWSTLRPVVRIALLQSFVVVAVGLGFALVQLRAANLMVPAVPLLAGFLVHAFTRIARESLLRAPAILVLLLAMPAVVEQVAARLSPVFPAMATQSPAVGDAAPARTKPAMACRTPEAMAEIASLPPSVVFSSLNLGPAIVAYTHHAATSASYHRNTAAFWNGIGPFENLDAMREALATSQADYLVLCTGTSDDRIVSPPLAETIPAWLVEVTGDRRLVRLFQVDKLALNNAGNNAGGSP